MVALIRFIGVPEIRSCGYMTKGKGLMQLVQSMHWSHNEHVFIVGNFRAAARRDTKLGMF